MLREQQDMEGEALITTMLFDDRYELFHDRIDIHAAAPMSREDYKAQGKAALFDAITNEGWHKFMPDGKVEEYRIGDAYGGDDSKAWEL